MRGGVILHRKSNSPPALNPLKSTILSHILQQERIRVLHPLMTMSGLKLSHLGPNACHFAWAIKKACCSTRNSGRFGKGRQTPLGWWKRSLSWLGSGLYTGVQLSFVKTHGPVHVRAVRLTVYKWYFDVLKRKEKQVHQAPPLKEDILNLKEIRLNKNLRTTKGVLQLSYWCSKPWGALGPFGGSLWSPEQSSSSFLLAADTLVHLGKLGKHLD